MNNNSLFLIDPDFKADASENCRLLLKITNDSFSYAVTDVHNGQVHLIFDKQACEDVAQALEEAFAKDIYLQRNYQSIKASVHTDHFVFIPNEWFDADNLQHYAAYLGTDQNIRTQAQANFGFNTIFALNSRLESNLPAQTQLYPQSESLLALKKHLADEAILIDFTANSFNFLYVKNGQLIFQNHFSMADAEEFNYFILLLIEQLSLYEHIPVYLQGIVNEDDEHYTCLLKYFNQLYFFFPAGKENKGLLADMPGHYFSALLALDLCE